MWSRAQLRTLAFLFLFGVSSGLPLIGQNLAPLTISPSKATINPGTTQAFRAVGKDGRIRHNVGWSIAPDQSAILTRQGDEVTVTGKSPGTVTLTANADGDSADATIEILGEKNPPAGTILWSVTPLPGCKSVNITQAVPSANGPDLYDQEQCSDGQYIRALTSDGREIWRRRFGGPGEATPNIAKPIASGPYIGILPDGATSGTSQTPAKAAGEHIHSRSGSVCDVISTGMKREEVEKALSARGISLAGRQRQQETWLIEEEGSRCSISFDASGSTVFKKKKTIVTD
jgi:hypothetical protein